MDKSNFFVYMFKSTFSLHKSPCLFVVIVSVTSCTSNFENCDTVPLTFSISVPEEVKLVEGLVLEQDIEPTMVS